MKVSILENDLVVLSKDHADNITQYKVNLAQLVFPEASKAIHNDFYIKIRTLNRVLDNLRNSEHLLTEIRLMLNQKGQRFAFNPPVKAMFCHAVVLYGACFLKGGKERVRPLSYKDFPENELKTHQAIMDYRDILFGHLDDNHGVRNDHLFCQFDVEPKGLNPSFVVSSGDRMVLASQAINGEWLRHLEYLIDKVSTDVESLKLKYENFLREHEFVVER